MPFRIYKQDADNDSVEQLTSGPGLQIIARISPEGQWLIYSSLDEKLGQSKTRLMRIPLEGGAAKEILTTEGVSGSTVAA
jgi:Tol biopolymer transport system component